MANPVLNSVTPETGASPYTLAPGAVSTWFLAVGTDADAKTVNASIKLTDETGRETNTLSFGPFVFTDALHIDPADITFPAGTPYAVEIDPANPLRFRIRNSNV